MKTNSIGYLTIYALAHTVTASYSAEKSKKTKVIRCPKSHKILDPGHQLNSIVYASIYIQTAKRKCYKWDDL
jgi:hypothetical protein